jgi:hypothetical protein
MSTEPTPADLAEHFTTGLRNSLADAAVKIRHCANQLDDAQLWWRPREEQNSIGNLMLHLAGNVRQWVISGVGGAADIRRRADEFAERGPIPKGELLDRLENVLAEADAVLAALRPEQLVESRRIQGFDTTVTSAVLHSVTHFCGHSQEIISMTRQQLGGAYRFHWAPKSAEEGAVE